MARARPLPRPEQVPDDPSPGAGLVRRTGNGGTGLGGSLAEAPPARP